MHRGLLSVSVTALLAFAVCSPALAQETPDAKEYCADAAPPAHQYGCEEPRSPDCVPQQQYDGETDGCATDPYQYGLCTASTTCGADSQAQNSITETLPPASVQNVVVAAANSVSKDATKASRALDTAEPVDPANNIALAAESEPVAEPTAYPPEGEPVAEPVAYPPKKAASEEVVVGLTTPPPAATASTTTAPVDTAAAPVSSTEAPPVKSTEAAHPTKPPEAAEVVADQERELEEVDGDPAASYEIVPVDRFVVPLFALGGSTLLIFGGLLVCRIVR